MINPTRMVSNSINPSKTETLGIVTHVRQCIRSLSIPGKIGRVAEIERLKYSTYQLDEIDFIAKQVQKLDCLKKISSMVKDSMRSKIIGGHTSNHKKMSPV